MTARGIFQQSGNASGRNEAAQKPGWNRRGGDRPLGCSIGGTDIAVVDEAITAIRRLFLTTLVIVVVWFIGFLSAQDKYTAYQEVKELYGWLILYNEVSHQLPWNVFDVDHLKVLDTVWEETGEQEAPNPGAPTLIPVPHKILIAWPAPQRYTLSLVPINSGLNPETERLYRVAINPPDLVSRPWNLLFEKQHEDLLASQSVRTSIKIGEVKLDGSLRQIRGQFRGKVQPPNWESISLHLAAHGFEDSWEKLSIADQSFKTLRAQVDPTAGTVTIFGIDLPFTRFLSMIGLLLTGLSFSLFGPILRLRATDKPASASPWIMTVPTTQTTAGRALEAVLISLSGIWVALPCIIAVLQVSSPRDLITAPRWVVFFGAAALLFSSVAWAMASFELYNLRHRSSRK